MNAATCSPHVTSDSDDGDVRHVVVLEEHLLDLARIDVLAAADDMSFRRPAMRQKPRVSIDARSPVRSQPSGSIAAAVPSGSSK
jgi:hypothetical protein